MNFLCTIVNRLNPLAVLIALALAVLSAANAHAHSNVHRAVYDQDDKAIVNERRLHSVQSAAKHVPEHSRWGRPVARIIADNEPDPAPWLHDVGIFNIGTLGTDPWTNVGHGGGVVKPGSFLDVYNFSIGSLTDFAVNAVSSTLSFGQSSILDIKGLKFELIDSSNRTLATSFGSPINWSGGFSTGNYRFQISGIADGTAGGAYLFSVAAVPEPGQWLLLVAGLLTTGYVARRRSRPSARNDAIS